MDVNVRVAVRCRPMSSKETARGCHNIIDVQGSSITIRSPDSNHEDQTFTFNFVYDGNVTQQQVYSDLGAPIVVQALDGFNGTIFAYGQTGSGKTHSMMGNEESKGIIPQLNDDLWRKITEKLTEADEKNAISGEEGSTQFLVTVSFLEVYNEEIKDLLNPSDRKLKIRESQETGIFVEDLCELVSQSLVCTCN